MSGSPASLLNSILMLELRARPASVSWRLTFAAFVTRAQIDCSGQLSSGHNQKVRIYFWEFGLFTVFLSVGMKCHLSPRPVFPRVIFFSADRLCLRGSPFCPRVAFFSAGRLFSPRVSPGQDTDDQLRFTKHSRNQRKNRKLCFETETSSNDLDCQSLDLQFCPSEFGFCCRFEPRGRGGEEGFGYSPIFLHTSDVRPTANHFQGPLQCNIFVS